MVAINSVCRANDNLSVILLLQLLSHRGKMNDLRGTDKGEVGWIEEDDQIFALVICKLTLSKLEFRGKDLHFKVGTRGAWNGNGTGCLELHADFCVAKLLTLIRYARILIHGQRTSSRKGNRDKTYQQ